MSVLERLKGLLTFRDVGIEYQCPSCGAAFETAHERCPECGELDLRERGGFERRSESD